MRETRLAVETGHDRLRCWVLHPVLKSARRTDPQPALDEACGLVQALDVLELAGGECISLGRQLPRTLFGSGKIQEIKTLIGETEIGLIVINGNVTPVQQRNLEEAWNIKILDRTGLILEIFGERARTQEGVLQVDLAHLSYQRSRLVRSWTHLERQRGGMGFMGGPGETQIEADRRALDDRIIKIRARLDDVTRTRRLHRQSRRRNGLPTVALVGYTNAGKSTLFNRLTGETVSARDMLFATLDPTMRGLELPDGRKIILSDTVGFISDLPTQLIAAFRATLEEVVEADLIVHVRDMASPQAADQAEDVGKVLKELGVAERQTAATIEYRNKVDLVPDLARNERDPRIIWGSARTGRGIDALKQAISAALSDGRSAEFIDLGHEQGAALAWLNARRLVESMEAGETSVRLKLMWSSAERGMFLRSFPDLIGEHCASTD